MPAFVALLRGVNVGTRRIVMADLRAALERAGFGQVVTHIQSGNVLLRTQERRAGAVGRSVEDAIRDSLGLDVDVIVRTPGQLAKVTRGNPFLDRGVESATLYVGFLKSKPPAAAAKALAGAAFDRDEFVLRGAELYLRYPDGLGRSKMSAAFFERTLRTPLTVRNWKVVTKLAELAAG